MSDPVLKYVKGYKSPDFIIRDLNYNFIEKISLAMCDKDGMIEKYIYQRKVVQLANYKKKIRQKGFYRRFTLSYKSKSDVINSIKISHLHDYSLNDENYIIQIVPRSEYQDVFHNVAFMNDELEIGIKRGGILAKGNTGLVLVYETYELEKSLNWKNPNDVQYFGFTYPGNSGVLQTS